MPRLTQDDYLRNHNLLRLDQEANDSALMHLTPNDQWDLFMYYLPHEQRTADELHISQSDPSLAHRAGRALMKLAGFRKRLLEYLKTSHPKSRKKGAPHKVRVLSQVNPDIDPKTMAKILIEIARECAREDRAS